MARVETLETIRRQLETDRGWAAYALADLELPYREHCEWHCAAEGGPAVLLLYRGFAQPVLVTVGPAKLIEPLLREIAREPALYFSVPPEIVPLLHDAGYEVRGEKKMGRMVLDPKRFAESPALSLSFDAGTEVRDSSSPGFSVRRLGSDNQAALAALYADGAPAGEAPDFFIPAMLDTGAYYGVYENETLVAAAGTHVLARSESVAAIGNVYTRRDRRGRGLAGCVTAAVTAELLRLGLHTIVLNVERKNTAAVRVYRRLGFVHYCDFCEGLAVKNPGRSCSL